jgi:D-alanine--poly(phosphoribitol) ligase subunit 2
MENKILKLLGDICGVGDSIAEDMEINLFESRLIDSLAMIELLIGIEDEVGIKIQPTEIERRDIDTPNKLIAYVKSRM